MQTKIQTKLALALFVLPLLFALVQVGSALAVVSSSLSQFSFDEDPSSDIHETDFIFNLTPDPIDLTTTTFTTDGQCILGHNLKSYSSGGAVVTENNNLVFGLRAVDDSDHEGLHQCNISFSSESTLDPAYFTAQTLNYTVIINDNDAPIISDYTVSKTSTAALVEGSSTTETYEINISHAPIYDVLITAIADSQCDLLSSSGPNQVRVRQLTKTFKEGEAVPISFSVIPIEDEEFEGQHQCTIQHTTSTVDFKFKNVIVPAYVTTLNDNDANPNEPDEREYEGGLIYFSDANLDGVDDEEQPGVTSFINVNVDARQGLMIVDQNRELIDGCKFTGGPTSSIFDNDSSELIQSVQGVIEVGVECDADQDYSLLWLLDVYDARAADWLIFDTQGGQPVEILSTSLIYSLGADFTGGILMDVDDGGMYKLVQSLPLNIEDEVAFEQSLVADVNNAKINPFAVIPIVSAGAAFAWLIHRRYFSSVDTVKSSYPKIDRF